MKCLDKKVIGVAVVALIVGLFLGYAPGYFGANTASLTQRISSLEDQVDSLESQLSTANAQKNSLQTWLTQNITYYQGQITNLQSQIANKDASISQLTSQISMLQDRIEELEAIHDFTVGAVLTTLSGGYEDKTGPAFYVPAGHVKIVVQLESLGEIRAFYLYFYKIGETFSEWSGSTENAGEWVNYVYSLDAGNYYLDASSINFGWQATVYVYES